MALIHTLLKQVVLLLLLTRLLQMPLILSVELGPSLLLSSSVSAVHVHLV